MSNTERFLTEQITIKLDKETKEQLKALAKQRGYPLSLFVREIIRWNVSHNQKIIP